MECTQAKLSRCLLLLQQHRSLLEALPTTTFIQEPSVPTAWLDALEPWSYDQLLRLPVLLSQVAEPSLRLFLAETLALSPAYPQLSNELPLSAFEAWGMNPKKQHEVRRLGAFIQQAANKLGVHRVIDLGAGLGYLSHFLTTNCGLEVEAVEAQSHHSSAAQERSRFLAYKLQQNASALEVTSLHVTAQNFACVEPCLLVGLHTCGDLAATSARIAAEVDAVRGLVNVGCCYNLLSESLPQPNASFTHYLTSIGLSRTGDSLEGTFVEKQGGFPLSSFILAHFPDFYLGRFARILALTDMKREMSPRPQQKFESYCFRAAFQWLLQEYCPNFAISVSVGKPVKHYADFGEYALQAAFQLQTSLPLSRQELNTIYASRFKTKEKRAVCQWILRAQLGPVVEHAILLDRQLFLQEQGLQTQLWQIFDPLISPRCWMLAAFKPAN